MKVFTIENNSWLFESCPIIKLSILILRKFLYGDMESDSKHLIAKVIGVGRRKFALKGIRSPMHAPLDAYGDTCW